MKKHSWINLCLILLFIASCAPKKHLRPLEAGQEQAIDLQEQAVLNEEVMPAQAKFSTLTARAQGFITLHDKTSQDVQLQIRIKSGEGIWISASAFLGREIGRLFLSPDTMQYMNRMESTYMSGPLSMLLKYTGWDLTYQELENLFVGNLPHPVDHYQTVNKTELGFVFRGTDRENEERIQLNAMHRLLSVFMRAGSGQSFTAAYIYEAAGSSTSHIFPKKWSVSAQSPEADVQATIEYLSMSFDADVLMPFSIPSAYNKIL